MTEPRTKSRWAKLIPIGIVLAAASAVGLTAAILPSRDRDKPPEPRQPINVQVESVQPLRDVADTFTLTGTVEPYRVIQVAAEVSGRVETYAARKNGDDRPVAVGDPNFRGPKLDEGDAVVAGQPLMFLNAELLQAARDQARAKLQYDQQELLTTQELYDQKVATYMNVEQQQRQVALSQAALEETEARLRRTTVHAPEAGTLNKLVVKEGEYVQPGQQVAEIVQTDRVKIVVDIPELEIGALRVGDEVDVANRLGPDFRTCGEISYISRTADPRTRTTRIEMTVPNTDHRLHDGQIVRVRMTRRRLAEVYLIPLDAIIPGEAKPELLLEDPNAIEAAGRYTVYLAKGDKAEPLNVDVDLRFVRGRRVRVEGLHAGDLLIVRGQRLVGPGQAIKITDGLPPNTAGADANAPPAVPSEPAEPNGLSPKPAPVEG